MKMEKNLVEMEKVEKIRKILAILEKIIVTIQLAPVGYSESLSDRPGLDKARPVHL